MQSFDPSTGTLSPETITGLSKIRNQDGPIFTLYLDLQPEKQQSADLLDRYESLLQEAEQQNNLDRRPSEFREHWNTEADRLRQWLRIDHSLPGQSLVVISSIPADLWRIFHLPVHIMDRLAAQDQPYIRPLEVLLGEARLTPEGKREGELEAQRVKELLNNARTAAAVLGLEQTLLAVKSNKVRLLVVEEAFHPHGWACPNCGFLGIGQENICLLCGMAMRPEIDIIEVALKNVLDQGGEIEILRSPESRQALASYGRIGALLKVSENPPTEKDTANQKTITKDGAIDRQVLQDETVEESFPASDPPGH